MSYTGRLRNAKKFQRKTLACYKTRFYHYVDFSKAERLKMAGKEQEKYVFKGVKVTENQAVFVQKIADKKFEGNFSMALRSILSKAHLDSQLCK